MQQLREKGISRSYIMSYKFDKQFKYAEKNIPYAVIIGSQELLRDLHGEGFVERRTGLIAFWG
jgi:histidyl-tRNA synthetase